jgi:uncharacterized protein (DUF433 family)
MAVMASLPKIVASAQITKNPRVCGGRACIDNTRIRVIDIVELEREGKRPEEMGNVFAVPLTQAQIYLALDYAAAHPDEIAQDFAEEAGAEAEIDKARAEYLSRRSGA